MIFGTQPRSKISMDNVIEPLVPRKRLLRVAFFLSFAVAGYALVSYAIGPGAGVLHPEMQAVYRAESIGIHIHIFASLLALLIGPFQFSASLRTKRPHLHRWLGRIYLGVAVAIGGLAGLYMSIHAFGGVWAKLGFAGLALSWLYTGFRAYTAIRAGEVQSHRRWMIRNYALTFAAVTLRLYLPWPFVFGWSFATSYAVIAWLCWVPNLALMEWSLSERRSV